MGNVLIFIILAVTIPRWALTLAQVDTFGLRFGGSLIPIAAIGEAVVLEFGNLFILNVFTHCQRHAFRWQADWERHDDLMREQGKRNRRPERDPRIRGYGLLPGMLLTLETMTLLAQTPFIAGQLLGVQAVSLLNEWGRGWVWAYAFLLVIAPGVMTVAIGFAINYDKVMREVAGQVAVSWPERVRQWLNAWRSGGQLARQMERPGGQLAGQSGRVGGQPANWPDSGRTVAGQADRQPGGELDDMEVSEALAGHLAELRDRLASMRQQGTRSNGAFRRADVQEALGISVSHAKNVIRYGLVSGVIAETSRRYVYEFVNKR